MIESGDKVVVMNSGSSYDRKVGDVIQTGNLVGFPLAGTFASVAFGEVTLPVLIHENFLSILEKDAEPDPRVLAREPLSTYGVSQIAGSIILDILGNNPENTVNLPDGIDPDDNWDGSGEVSMVHLEPALPYPILCKGCEEGVHACYCSTDDHLKEIERHMELIGTFSEDGTRWTKNAEITREMPVVPYFIHQDENEDGPQSALDSQEGGDHYKNLVIQPVEFCHANGIEAIESSIIKYAVRHRDKNGAEDVRKIIHYAKLLLELEYGETLEEGR